MKMRSWLMLLILSVLVCGLFLFFEACGDDDEVIDEEEPAEEEEELPQCDKDYASAPVCNDIVEFGGLQWTQCDNGADIDHNCAVNYVADLTVGGNEDWRLPTIAELVELYNNENPQTVNCEVYMANIVTPFQITCLQMWSSQNGTIPDSSKSYSFLGSAQQTEGQAYDIEKDKSGNLRVLAVRKP